ncbi:metallophosphoesterase [Clostridium sp. YIM B02505]|uniref:Metallophosphoesterase n=1 Tax=Clostridium yunnanense TaxID=2800325 RepID=A0ABS1EJM3_9CLOT|nr:metallophosphoesterase [Clostridium yunnanense]MBK1809533.1 metallophosphoesterase [Clostridium yunnanense]
MSEVFITADTHFGDANIIAYEKRPFSNLEDMDKQMIASWNSVVKEDDIVFHLGDVSSYPLSKMKEIINKLNGKKILIMGNHDNHLTISQWMECGFDEVYKYPIVYNEFIVMQHQPPQYINSATPFFYLYGHVHGTEMYPTVAKQSACVSVERWDYAPVKFEYIKKCVEELTR